MKLLVLVAALAACGKDAPPGPPRRAPETIKVAIVGGMTDTGFWPEIENRYEAATGDTVEVEMTGPKPRVVAAFRAGGIDLITVHACDAMVNLVADGLAENPQPWLRNDLVIVGPETDPAGIRGERDAGVALKRIIETKSKLLIHSSFGADGVLHDLQESASVTLDAASTIVFLDENQHAVLERAKAEQAYTIVGRIPFKNGKLRAEGIVLMVQGDPRLRRPYLVEVSTSAGQGARDLAAYLRSPETQAFIAQWGKGKLDDEPVFFPVTVATSAR